MSNLDPSTERQTRLDLDIETALGSYFPNHGYTVREGASGMNNTTRYVTCSDGSAYVLRIYETHRDAEKAEYEHRILLAAVRGMSPDTDTDTPTE
jgi:homoserine kinase type II